MGSTDPSGQSVKPEKRRYSLAVCRFPGNNAEHPASSGWVIAMGPKWMSDTRISRVIPLRRSDTPIHMVRNLLVKKALDEGADYILMIDSDMQPDVEPDGLPFWDTSWKFMLDRRAREHEYREAARINPTWFDSGKDFEGACFERFPPATIAAPYCGPPPSESVYVMKWDIPESNTLQPNYKLKMFERSEATRFSGIMQVAALPTGLILYDSRVFRRLPPPWFNYEYTDEYMTEKSSTEDIYQTRNASLIGMTQFVNWDAWAGHIKPKVVRKPRLVCIDDVPNMMADAIRKGIRGDQKVVVLSSPDDAYDRPSVV